MGFRMLHDLGADMAAMQQEILAIAQGAPTGGEEATKSSTPKLDKFGRDLTLSAKNGELDPVIGRSEEIERIIQILSRRTKNNPGVSGEPGVGNSEIAAGLEE